MSADKKAHNFIQWKGTDVCMDFYCECGHQGHIDADFAYYVKCGKCGAIWKLADHVEMEKITPPLWPDIEPVMADYDPEIDGDYDWRKP